MNDSAPSGPVLHRDADPARLAARVADTVAEGLREAIARRGQALLVVSGGATPVPMWQQLRGQALDWSRVSITLADERWVPPLEAASNEGLLRRHLLQDKAASAVFVPLFNGAASPQEGQAETEARLAALPWPADVLVLGMGGDGHTASWFPGRGLPAEDAPGLSMPVDAPDPPNVVVPRLSLTPFALRGAARVLLHLTGADKEPVLARALMPGDPRALPVRRALHGTGAPCQVFYAP